MNDEDNWLHGERIECLSCHQLLYRVDHSPFYDEHFLYCDRCPIHVGVSYYDPVYKRIFEQVIYKSSTGQNGESIVLMRAIEACLKSCICGGTFRHDAPRRCFICHSPVILDDPIEIDLFRWSNVLLSDSPDSAPDELEEEERWMLQFIRTEDKWQDDTSEPPQR